MEKENDEGGDDPDLDSLSSSFSSDSSSSSIQYLDVTPIDLSKPVVLFYNQDVNHYAINALMFPDPRALPQPKRDYSYTVVIDLDETLVSVDKAVLRFDRDNYAIFLRPNSAWFLHQLHKHNFEIIIWSAGTESHVSRCIRLLDPNGEYISAAIYRDDCWFRQQPLIKDLNLIPYRDLTRCFLIENSPETAMGQYDRVVIVPSFYSYDTCDAVLPKLFDLLHSQLVAEEDPCFNRLLSQLGDDHHHSIVKDDHHSYKQRLTLTEEIVKKIFPRTGYSVQHFEGNNLGIVKVNYYKFNHQKFE